MRGILIIILAGSLVAAGGWAAGAADKKAAAAKEAEGAAAEHDAAVAAMRSFERVTPALEVAVMSCRVVKPPEAKEKKEEESSVTVSGDNWAALAGALLRAADRGTTPSTAKGGEGRAFIHVDIRVKNVSDKTVLVAPADFTLTTPDGYAAPYNVKTFEVAQPFAGVYLPPGATAGGVLVFAQEPYPRYILNYYNPATGAAGTKELLLTAGG